MNFDYNKQLESKNFIDGIDFTADDPCIWNVYPPGASGDLLASIINCHYGNTGSNYYGINQQGQVIFRPSDYKITNTRCQNNQTLFDKQYFFDIATSLSDRNINYSIMDQFLFSCHLHQKKDIEQILSVFPKCKIIRTYFLDSHGQTICKFMSDLKNLDGLVEPCFEENQLFHNDLIRHPQLLNIPYGALFKKRSYYKWYDKIIKFLNLKARLICFDYVEYYISKQHPLIKHKLIEYGLNHDTDPKSHC